MRRWFTLISALLIISSGTVAQSARSSWPPTLVWSASSFECPAVDTKRKIEDAALDGDAGAQTQFGKAQVHSCPGWKNPVESLQFLNLAAEKNNVEAQITLGDIFRDGNAVPKDLFQATKWFARAARQGDARAQNDLGVSYALFALIPQKDTKAFELFLEAAQNKLPEAQYNLATRYDLGIGVAQSHETARRWYGKAADQKQSDAAYRLAQLAERGLGGPKDPAAATIWLNKAADFGSEDAQIKLGRKTPSQARSANSGYYQYFAAMSYLTGRGVPKDQAKAIEFLQKSADAGFPQAMVELGSLYQYGNGTTKDERKAQAYFLQSIARDAKYHVAYNNLAWLYVTTKDPKLHNAKKALELATKAVELSNKQEGASLDTLAHAYFELGKLDLALENEQLAEQLAPNDEFIRKTLGEYKAAKENQKPAK
ncbi:MAG TPA: tetratricopeptide repeat protein [Candidatus Eisenbacteria bacterium]|nr:tetratricopeptide repeat protein [Candidatus Eisenbacteria bacterium]